MKRMLDQKTIDELSALLSKISIDEYGYLEIENFYVSNTARIENLQLPNGLIAISDEEDEPLFPLENNAGKVLAVNEDGDGVDAKDLFAGFTHSFNELDPTLKAIVDEAISNGSAVCTQAQWNVIKALLDKSLYFYYLEESLIRVSASLDNYRFGYDYGSAGLDGANCFNIGWGDDSLNFKAYSY